MKWVSPVKKDRPFSFTKRTILTSLSILYDLFAFEHPSTLSGEKLVKKFFIM